MAYKAIETVYNGYRFRSRLEARWAVFFDALRIEYEFEPEGFELSNGTWYLPDFYLPTFGGGLWAEVKPDRDTFSVAIQFARDSRSAIWLCEGIPTFAIYRIVGGGWNDEIWCGIPNYNQAYNENRMYIQPCEHCSNYIETSPLCNLPQKLELDMAECYDDWYIDAIHAARQARFEHGETPRIP